MSKNFIGSQLNEKHFINYNDVNPDPMLMRFMGSRSMCL